MSLLLPATLFLAFAAPGAGSPHSSVTVELPPRLSHEAAHSLIAGIRADALRACRHENRHGAMAERAIRLCTADLVSRTVQAAGRPILTEVHAESPRGENCPNMPVRRGARGS